MGLLNVCDLFHQSLLLRGHREQLAEGALRLRLPLAARDLPKELGGTDARQGPPGRSGRIERLHDLIDAQLQGPLLLPLHVESVYPRLDRHDPLHMLGHGQAFCLAMIQNNIELEFRLRSIGQDVRLSQKQTDFFGHVVEKAFGVGDQLNHG